MEISPIPGIRSLPVMKTPRTDADISRVFDIVNSPKPDDDTYSSGEKRGAGGEDGDKVPAEGSEATPLMVPAAESEDVPVDKSLGVNFFA